MTNKRLAAELEKLLKKTGSNKPPPQQAGGGSASGSSSGSKNASIYIPSSSPPQNSNSTMPSSNKVNQQPQKSSSTKLSGNAAGHKSTVKTNYTKGQKAAGKASAAAGYGASHGSANKSSNTSSVGSKVAASESYQNRESSQSQTQKEQKETLEQERGEKMSNTYNRDGELMTQSEFKQYKSELAQSDIEGMRRIVISPDPTLNITPQEMSSITRDAMHSWQEYSGKQFEFTYAVHDGQSVIHSHVLQTSQNQNDINMASRQLETFKGLIDEAIQTQLDLREGLSEKSGATLIHAEVQNGQEVQHIGGAENMEGELIVENNITKEDVGEDDIEVVQLYME